MYALFMQKYNLYIKKKNPHTLHFVQIFIRRSRCDDLLHSLVHEIDRLKNLFDRIKKYI